MSFISRATDRYRYSAILLRQMVVTDFKLRYQNSVLGYLWSLLKPLALFSIIYVVFVYILPVGKDVPNFSVYLLLGIVLWNFFSEITNLSVKAIVDKGDLLRKLNFPRYTIVLSTAVSALINLVLNLLVVGLFMLFADINFDLKLLWMPFLLLELFVFSLAIGFILSALYVKFRDLSYIWEVVMQAAFYATPIIYPFTINNSRISGTVAQLISLNPMAQIMQDLRYIAITRETATIGYIFGNEWARLFPIGLTVLLAVVAVKYFRSQSKHFAEGV